MNTAKTILAKFHARYYHDVQARHAASRSLLKKLVEESTAAGLKVTNMKDGLLILYVGPGKVTFGVDSTGKLYFRVNDQNDTVGVPLVFNPLTNAWESEEVDLGVAHSEGQPLHTKRPVRVLADCIVDSLEEAERRKAETDGVVVQADPKAGA